MGEQLRHEGIIMSKNGSVAHVRIAESPACEDCKAASLCHSAEKTEKFVDAVLPAGGSYQVGDRVVVAGSLSMGMRATWLGFGIPLLLMVAGILVGARVLGNETTGALAGLSLLLPYYLVLWLFRSRLDREFVFRVV